MADVSVVILGLGRLGTSVSLALKRYNEQKAEHQFTIVGYDNDPDRVKAAQKLNALDKVENHPDKAVAGRDIIVMAMPYGDVIAAYEYLKPEVRSGAVILDMSPLKQRSMDWGKKNLPEDVHMICAMPVINPAYLFDGVDETKRATADLFDKGVMLLMPSVTAIKEAISLAADLSRLIGARPHFTDAYEYDVLATSATILPDLLGALYFDVLSSSGGWTDAQRIINPPAGMLSRTLFDTHPDDLRDVIQDSREPLIRHIDELMERIRDVRQILVDNDREALESFLDSNSKEYERWINRRTNDRWQTDDQLDADSPTFGSLMGNMFGGFMVNRGSKDKEN